jgi:hypothetical protein
LYLNLDVKYLLRIAHAQVYHLYVEYNDDDVHDVCYLKT